MSEGVGKVAGPAPGTGAREAVARLVDQHGPRLYGLASRLCGNAADAQDMVQEVFLQALRKWGTFRGAADAGTWLYAIAARSCKARLRRKGGVDRRMPAVSQLMPFGDSRVVAMPARGGEGGPEAEAMERESARVVHAAILTLPEHFRVPLVLKEMLELPIDEVAAALNIKPETVKTRVHRARLLLRKAIVQGAKVRTGPAPEPIYERRVCLDLLKAKMEAMDRGRGFPIGQEVVCERCRAVFAELDLAQSACGRLAEGRMPERMRAAILRALREDEGRGAGLTVVRRGGGGRSARAR